MLGVICFLWQGQNLARDPATGQTRLYEAEHVNGFARMFSQHLCIPHQVICIADHDLCIKGGFDRTVKVVPLPASARWLTDLKTPEAGRFPTCYRRLWIWSAEAAELAERFLVCDIDLLLTGDITPLVDRLEDFVGWRPRATWGPANRFAGGLYLLRAGARRFVWDNFKGLESIAEARRAGYRGSDQAWISYCLNRNGPEAAWSPNEGIYSIRDLKNGALPLPLDARLVQFNGPQKPWSTPLPWAKAIWNGAAATALG